MTEKSDKELFETINYRGYDILLKVDSNSRNDKYTVVVRTPMSTPPEMALLYKEENVSTIMEAKNKLNHWFAEATTVLDKKESESKELEEFAESLEGLADDLEEKQIKLDQYIGRLEQQKNL